MKRAILSAGLALSGLASLVSGNNAYAQETGQDSKKQEIPIGFFSVKDGKLEPNYGSGYKEGEIVFTEAKNPKPSYKVFVSDIWATKEGSSFADMEKVLTGAKTYFTESKRIHIGIELNNVLTQEQLTPQAFSDSPEVKYELFDSQGSLVRESYTSKIGGRIKQVTIHPRLKDGIYIVNWSLKNPEDSNENWKEITSIMFEVKSD